MCDGSIDCSDGEDELKCSVECDDYQFPCMTPEFNETHTASCIHKKHVCDGLKNCPKGEDEKDCPYRKECNEKFNCSQLCIVHQNGTLGCDCRLGYKLDSDGIR